VLEPKPGNLPLVEPEGWLLARGHRVTCPEGELGTVHVSTLARPVTKQQFEAARAIGTFVLTPLIVNVTSVTV
jgi:hypothetical protein